MRHALNFIILGLATCLALPAQAATTLTESSTWGHPGASIKLTGSGFGASEAVDVYLDVTDTLLLVSSSTGAFTASVTIPASEQPGTHYLTAIGRHSGDAVQVALTVTTPWIEQGFGAGHLAWNPYENTISTSNVATLGEIWSAPISTEGSAPAVFLGNVYVTSSSGIKALSTTTGAVTWSALPGTTIYGSPVVTGGVVYTMGSSDPTFYALNAYTGVTKWTQTLGGATLSSPIVSGGTVYIPCFDSYLYALNATTGAILWKTSIGTTAEAMPAVVDGVVYVGSGNTIYALNAATGALIWSYATGATVEGSPTVLNGVLYEGSDDGYLYALRIGTTSPGTLLWRFSTGNDVYQTPAASAGIVYIGSQNQNFYALNAHTGALIWSLSTNGIVDNAIIANQVVYVTTRDGTLYALNAATGATLATAGVGYSFLGNPVVSDGVLYLNTYGGNTYAFGLLGGTAAAKPATAPRISSLHPDLTLQVTH
jgi:outer membrane protein assembly factor BamB